MPYPSARALDSPANACSRAWATLTRSICPWHRAGGWHSHFWANPEGNQKQGVPGWELLEGQAYVEFTPAPGALPQAWHRAALDPYLLTLSECEAASQRPEPGPGASQPSGLFPPRPALLSWGRGTAGPVWWGHRGRLESGHTHPNLPGPPHCPRGRVSTAKHPVSQEKWPVACANISTEEKAALARDSYPWKPNQDTAKNAWKTSSPSTA